MDASSEQDQEQAEQGDESLGTRSEVEEVDACRRRLKCAIPAEKVSEELDGSYRELGKTVQLPGFRAGRVPRRLLEARFGEEIEKQVKEHLLGLSLAEVVEENELKVIGTPKFDNIEFAADADFTYEVDLEVQPEFELGKYKGIEVALEPEPVTDEDVDKQLVTLQQDRPTMTAIDAAAAGPEDSYKGEYILLRDGGKVRNAEELAFRPSDGRMGPFTVENLAGRVQEWDKESGDPLKIEVEVPQAFPEEVLRGARVELQFSLETVERAEFPELDDAFAKELGSENMEALRSEIRGALENAAERKAESKIEEEIVRKLCDATQLDVPSGLLESQKRRWRTRREYELLVEGGLPPDKVKEELEKEAEAAGDDVQRDLKVFFILERVSEKERLFATETEVSARIRLLAAYHGLQEAQLREQLKEGNRLDDLRVSIRHEKVRAFLRKKARLLNKDGSPSTGEAGEPAEFSEPAESPPAESPPAESPPAESPPAESPPAEPPEPAASAESEGEDTGS